MQNSALGVAGALAGAVAALWYRHGGVAGLGDGKDALMASLGQLAGLSCSLAVLYALVLAGRPRVLERHVGLDTMLVWHRRLGQGAAVLLVLHIAAELAAAVPFLGVGAAVRAYTGGEPYMAMATVAAAGFATVTISSVRRARRRFGYETWYFIHLLVYGALALAFWHQVVLGTDFADDKAARVFWTSLNVAALLAAVLGRWGGAVHALLRPYVVESVKDVGDGIVEATLRAPGRRGRRADAGQFAFLRFLAPGLWWQAHPFSLSTAPAAAKLIFTIKHLGDATAKITQLRPGTRVAVEGPYGAVTPDVIGSDKVLLVAGGVGISPVKALLERLGPDNDPVVLYRARSQRDLAHIDELAQLAGERGARLLTAVGKRSDLGYDPFDAELLAQTVPDIARRRVVVCGPEAMIDATVRASLRCGVPSSRVHHERMWW